MDDEKILKRDLFGEIRLTLVDQEAVVALLPRHHQTPSCLFVTRRLPGWADREDAKDRDGRS